MFVNSERLKTLPSFAKKTSLILKKYFYCQAKYGFNPYRVKYINPQNINFAQPHSEYTNKRRNAKINPHYQPGLERGCFLTKNIGLVLSGDWDLESIPIEQMIEYKSMYDFIKRGCDWLETPWSRNIEKHIAINGAKKYSGVNDYRINRPKDVSFLVNSINKYGVLPCSKNPLEKAFFDNVNVNQR